MIDGVRTIEELRSLEVSARCRSSTFSYLGLGSRVVIYSIIVLEELEAHEVLDSTLDWVDVKFTVDEVLGCIHIEQQVSYVLRTQYHIELVTHREVQLLHFFQEGSQIHISQTLASVGCFTGCQHDRHVA